MAVKTVDHLHWELLPHPPYSPDLALSDVHLFTHLKKRLRGQEFHTDDACQEVLQ